MNENKLRREVNDFRISYLIEGKLDKKLMLTYLIRYREELIAKQFYKDLLERDKIIKLLCAIIFLLGILNSILFLIL